MSRVDFAMRSGKLIGKGSFGYVVEAVPDDTEDKTSAFKAILIKNDETIK